MSRPPAESTAAAVIRHWPAPAALIHLEGERAWRVVVPNREFERVFGAEGLHVQGVDVRHFFDAPFEELLAAHRALCRNGETERGAAWDTGIATVDGHALERHRERTEARIALVEIDRDRDLHLLFGRARDQDSLSRALRRSRERFQTLIADNPDMNYILDRSGHVLEMNPAGERMLGYTLAELQAGGDFTQRMPEPDIAAAREHFARVMAREVQEFETHLVTRDGDTLALEVLARPIVEEGEVVALFGIARDVTESRRIERELRESEFRYRSLFEDNVDAVVIYDTDGRFRYLNRATEELVGRPASALIGTHFSPVVAPERRAATEREFARARAGETVQYETVVLRDRGEKRDLHVTLVPIVDTDAITGVHCIAKDITALKRAQRQLQQMAYFDPLTGLPNRNSLETNLSRQVGEDRSFAVLAIDLDRLKSVNDTWGREAGDRLLQVAAHRLRERLPAGADVFRYSGDDFVLTYYCREKQECWEFALEVDRLLAEPIIVGETEIALTTRIGVSTFPRDGRDPETLLSKADQAMFAARQNGRHHVAFYSELTTDGDARRLRIEFALRGAVAQQQLSLAYQPQIDLRTGEVHGAEALLRWTHPDLGAVAPDEFIPVAEETGMIHDIGAWVMREACAQLRAWSTGPLAGTMMSVNLSITQFYDHNFADELERIVRDARIDPTLLVLEITESIASNSEVVVSQLHRFKRIGVRIAIDDFGTGYSSLRYLQDFPVDYLKIDRSFIEPLGTSPTERNLVATITTLARNFNLETIAEGTETAQQVDIMRELGAHYAQGYVFSRPLAAADFERWVAGR